MDTSDTRIVFDEKGICDHCYDFHKNVRDKWLKDQSNHSLLEQLVAKIKKEGVGKDFDCILGLSGGVDSSYMLHLAVKEFGLRPLVFHVDGGWNTEISVHNIEMLVDKLNLDLYTEVINWEEMRDFQLAFFKSGVPHIDIPQDHAFVATLYNYAEKYKIKYILNGGNVSTECVRNPMQFLYYGTDMTQINDIRRKFGTNRMESYPFSSVIRHKFYLRYIKGLGVLKLLNYTPYILNDAKNILISEYGWKAYPQKHFESRFTRFYEGFWLPKRFGFDTRRVQYSSLILTGQMTREDAIEKLKHDSLDSETVEKEYKYVSSKLGITTDELNIYFSSVKKFYWDYKNEESIFRLGARILKLIGVEKTIKR